MRLEKRARLAAAGVLAVGPAPAGGTGRAIAAAMGQSYRPFLGNASASSGAGRCLGTEVASPFGLVLGPASPLWAGLVIAIVKR